MSTRISRAAITILSCVLACGTLAACGDAPEEKPAPERGDARRVELPPLASVPAAERAAYALERLMRGPESLHGLPVPYLHRRNLELASSDLIGLAPEALKLLRDPALIERVTEQALRPTRDKARPNVNPWQNVLAVLLALDSKPAPLVLAWTGPALRIPVDSVDLAPIRLQAAHVLATVDDESTASLLFEFLAADPGNRDVGLAALPSLLERGAPWRARAMDVIVRGGAAGIWPQVPTRVAGLVPPGQTDRRVADLLAWWTALIEGSGPPPPATLPKLKNHRWALARLGLDPDVPRVPTVDGQAQNAAYGPLPSSVTHGSGWYATDLSRQAVFPLFAYWFDGSLTAAQTRCRLARYGYEGFRAAVLADLAAEAPDLEDEARPRNEGLYYAALHCMLDVDPSQEYRKAVARLRELLDDPPAPSLEHALALSRLVRALPPCVEPESWDLLVRVMREVRPLDLYRPVLESTFELMIERETEQKLLLHEMLTAGETDAATRGVALHLIRLIRDAEFLPDLERALDQATDPGHIQALQRIVLYIYTGQYGIEPQQYPAMVARVLKWVEAGEPAEAAPLSTALLDLGEPGVAAFAAGLRGERRRIFLGGWPQDRQLVPVRIAEALLESVDASTPADEVAHVLALAYHNFPEAGAPALAALERRVAPALRPQVAAVLKRVRHRAPRHSAAGG